MPKPLEPCMTRTSEDEICCTYSLAEDPHDHDWSEYQSTPGVERMIDVIKGGRCVEIHIDETIRGKEFMSELCKLWFGYDIDQLSEILEENGR